MMLADALTGPRAISAAATAPAGTSVLNFISALRVEPVSDTAHGVDQSGLSTLFELLTDPRDMHLEGVGTGAGIHRPDRLRHLCIRHQSAPVAHQRGENSKLESGEA